MSSTLTKYRYEPLPRDGGKHIRIVTIHPGRFDDDIRVSLRVEEFNVDNSRLVDSPNADSFVPKYEAMSYCWGPPEDAGRIFLRDAPSSKRNRDDGEKEKEKESDKDEGEDIWDHWLPARANLISALRHLRREDRPRDMWIDALCIDQDDVIQKGPQVAIMGTLYSQATGVVVWLGPTADGSDRAVELLRSWGSQVDYDIRTDTIHASTSLLPEACDEKMADMSTPLDCNGGDSLAVYRLFCREWFVRLWVRQEIILSNTSKAHVQCGSSVIPWEVFRNAWGALHTKHTSDDAEFGSRLERRMYQIYGFLSQPPRIPLSWLRHSFAAAQCSDARDRIYAVCSMLPDENANQAIRPNYTKTTIEVYQDATMSYLCGDLNGDIRILEDCRLHPGWDGPSWVPDWSYLDGTVISLDDRRVSGNILPSTKGWELVKPGVLQVRGVAITKVTEVYPLQNLKDIQRLLACERRAMDSPCPAGGTVLDAYARIVSNGRYRDIDVTPGANSKPSFKTVREYLLQLQEGGLEAVTAEVPIWLGRTLTGRVFLHSDCGLIGLGDGQECIQPGDEICAVFGCHRCIVLRPLYNQHECQYRVVGRCELDGASLGESILGPLPPNTRHVWAQIKVGGVTQAGWAFQDNCTHELIREDPRLLSLGVNLDKYRRDLEEHTFPWLRVDPEILEERLAMRGVHVRKFTLV